MKEILSDFNSIPGVLGAFVFEGDLIHVTTLSEFLSSEKLKKVVQNVSRAFYESNKEGFCADKITFNFSDGILLSKGFGERTYLSIFCDNKINVSSLDLIIDLTIEKIKKRLIKNSVSNSHTGIQYSNDANEKIDTENLMDGVLGPVLQEIEEILCIYIGPAGEIVLSDAIESWSRSGSIDVSQLNNLLQIIIKELDAGESEEWIEEIKKVIQKKKN